MYIKNGTKKIDCSCSYRIDGNEQKDDLHYWIDRTDEYSLGHDSDLSDYDWPDPDNYESLSREIEYETLLQEKDESNLNKSRYEMLINEMKDTYNKKNSDYGNAFDILLDDVGIDAALTQIGIKWMRFRNLAKKKSNNYESLEDTLLDMANYAIMTVAWMVDNRSKTN